MVKLQAKKKNGNITLTEDCFEHLLNCLDNQKFIDYETSDNQKFIDDFNRQCRIFWMSDEEEKDWTFDSDRSAKQSNEINRFKESVTSNAIKWIEVGD